jgi:hypothetical protein
MPLFTELRAMSKEDLVRQYDEQAPAVNPLQLNFLREEIARRDAGEQADRIEAMTREMRDMTRDVRKWTRELRTLTWVVAGLTAVAAIPTVVAART